MTRTPSRTARTRIGATAVGVLGLAVASATLGTGQANAASVATWDKVAQCESTGNWSINTNNGYYGGLQISLSNWQHYGGTAYAARPDLATKQQQILIAEKILADQGAGAWTCSPGTGLATDHANPYPDPTPAPTPTTASSSTASPVLYNP
ncbi:transglycosylase family protein, partial [Kitasatospora sp. NPDC056531]|uniref:transglycosylase family protein n=1 Tax=Kitasatospora sp. NPDC056531 TaxID=3345856 RepID=UPI0036BCA9A4